MRNHFTFPERLGTDNPSEAIDHFITYSVIDSNPALGYSSLLSQIRLFPVTSGEHRGSTFVQWSAQFSGDAGVGECSLLEGFERRD